MYEGNENQLVILSRKNKTRECKEGSIQRIKDIKIKTKHTKYYIIKLKVTGIKSENVNFIKYFYVNYYQLLTLAEDALFNYIHGLAEIYTRKIINYKYLQKENIE